MSVFRIAILGLMFSATVNAEVIRLSEPVESDQLTETFGSPINEALPVFSLSEIVGDAENVVGQNVLIQTRIGKVCQKKGCFFLATEGALAIRVSFSDYSFFVPTNSGGKAVTLAGQLIQKELSGEEAAHFNADLQDGGQDDGSRLSAGRVYEIVADAVRIPLAGE